MTEKLKVRYTILSGNLDINEKVPERHALVFAYMVRPRLETMGYDPEVIVEDAEGCGPSPVIMGHDESFNEDEALSKIDYEVGGVYSRWLKIDWENNEQ